MFLYELSYYINRIEKVMYRLKIQHKFIVLKNHSVNQQTFRNYIPFYLLFNIQNVEPTSTLTRQMQGNTTIRF